MSCMDAVLGNVVPLPVCGEKFFVLASSSVVWGFLWDLPWPAQLSKPVLPLEAFPGYTRGPIETP